MHAKYLLFQSKSEYHAGKQAQADRKYGLAVVRFEVVFAFVSMNEEIFFISIFSERKILLNNRSANVLHLHLHRLFVQISMK